MAAHPSANPRTSWVVAHPLLAVALALLSLLIFTNLISSGFQRLGLSPTAVTLVLLASLVGSLVNIPLWRRDLVLAPAAWRRVGPWVYYRPPRIEGQVIALNVGGAVVPLTLSAWLLPHVAVARLILATAVVTLAAYRISRVEPEVGVVMPALIAPFFAGAAAWLLTGFGGPEAAPLAYISGTVGCLLGADLLHFPEVMRTESGFLSIGGAGVFDGIFLVGVIAAALS
ncbi:MAG: DUF1614 domain-containing protein [Dehalococcoidia bacterium]|nr:DUF1614 domain-containing protein [Dehalococcoidia bacterium]